MRLNPLSIKNLNERNPKMTTQLKSNPSTAAKSSCQTQAHKAGGAMPDGGSDLRGSRDWLCAFILKPRKFK